MPDSCHILAYCVPRRYERADLRPLVGCFWLLVGAFVVFAVAAVTFVAAVLVMMFAMLTDVLRLRLAIV